MSEKDDDEQKQKEKLFMTETSGLEREEPLRSRPKSSKINSATTNDLATADDADEDEDDDEDDDEEENEDDGQEGDEDNDEGDEDEEEEDDYDDYMDEYADNPFYEYQLPQPGVVTKAVDGGENAVALPGVSGGGGRGDGVEQTEENVNGLALVEEEIRPLSAVAPKIFQQPDDGNVHIEISSTPAFQCLEEVRKLDFCFSCCL